MGAISCGYVRDSRHDLVGIELQHDPASIATSPLDTRNALAGRSAGYDQSDHAPVISTNSAINPFVVICATIASPSFPRR